MTTFLFEGVANHFSFKLSGMGFVCDANGFLVEALMRISSRVSYSFLSATKTLLPDHTERNRLPVATVLCIWGKPARVVIW